MDDRDKITRHLADYLVTYARVHGTSVAELSGEQQSVILKDAIKSWNEVERQERRQEQELENVKQLEREKEKKLKLKAKRKERKRATVISAPAPV